MDQGAPAPRATSWSEAWFAWVRARGTGKGAKGGLYLAGSSLRRLAAALCSALGFDFEKLDGV